MRTFLLSIGLALTSFPVFWSARPSWGRHADTPTAPFADISNGQLHARLWLPDPKNGFYRGTRFDWSGSVANLEYHGHTYFGN